MRTRGKIILAAVLLLVLLLLTVICMRTGITPAEQTARQADGAAETAARLAQTAEEACLRGGAEQITLADGGSRAAGSGVRIEGDKVTIGAPGIYALTGMLTNGQVVIDTDGTVILLLSNVSITNPADAAIRVANAAHVLVYLPEGSESTLISGTGTEITAASESEAAEAAAGAALYARDDLSLAGPGKLTVKGWIHHGIATTDRLTILGGNLEIEAVSSGLVGKDGVTVLEGSLRILSGNDGIKTNNETDAGAGSIDIRGGSVTISAFGDGIQADRDLTISGGALAITTGGFDAEAEAAPAATPQSVPEMPGDPPDFSGDMSGFTPPGGSMPEGTPPDGFGPSSGSEASDGFGPSGGSQAPGGFTPPDGTTPPDGFTPPDDFSPPDMPMPGGAEPESSAKVETDGSEKGLKCGQDLHITGGSVTICSTDDALHAGGSLRVDGGTLSLASGDDGLHADDTLTINAGEVTVSRAYEGLEAHQIFLNGGSVSLTASDDGINAFGGADFFGGPFAAQPAEEDDTTPLLYITGGTLYVNAEGDGLDSNGDLIIDGGSILVEGPTIGGNGSLDSGSENGGSLRVNGGTILAIGASGMAETFDDSSAQCSFHHILSSTATAGTQLTIADENGRVLCEHTAAKSFSSVIFSSSDLVLGHSYTLTVGEETVSITMESISNGESQGFGSFGGGLRNHGSW